MPSYGTFDPNELPERQKAKPVDVSTLVDENGEPLPSFDQRWQEPFEGLLYLGALTKSFEWLGHSFTVRTLGPEDQLAIAMVAKDYVGTMGESLAYSTAVAAMATVEADGNELPAPIGDSADLAAWCKSRFTYVTRNWYQFTIAKVFEQYLELEATAAKVVDAMGKAFGQTANSTPGSNGTSESPSAEGS